MLILPTVEINQCHFLFPPMENSLSSNVFFMPLCLLPPCPGPLSSFHINTHRILCLVISDHYKLIEAEADADAEAEVEVEAEAEAEA